jgi:protein TonB
LNSAVDPIRQWTPTSKRRGPKGFWESAVSALAIELGVVGLAIVWVVMHPPEEIQQVVPLVMALMDAPKEPQPEPPKPQKVPEVAPKMKTPPPVAQVVPEVKPVDEPPPPVVAKANAFSAPPPQVQPAAPAPAAPVPPVVDPAIAYNQKLSAAVQAAFVVPGTATALGFKGRARVEFHLKDGVVSNVKVIQASGLGAVDRAALKAVEAAVFPAPPAALVGKEGVYQIWVACF